MAKLIDMDDSETPRSGFAAGVAGDGGYADVKLLLYADLGKHVAFDGTAPWTKTAQVNRLQHVDEKSR